MVQEIYGTKVNKGICCVFCYNNLPAKNVLSEYVCDYTPQGEGGFGYDPVFFVPPLKKTFAQLTAEEKNAISHRGKALEVFQVKLEAYLKK